MGLFGKIPLPEPHRPVVSGDSELFIIVTAAHRAQPNGPDVHTLDNVDFPRTLGGFPGGLSKHVVGAGVNARITAGVPRVGVPTSQWHPDFHKVDEPLAYCSPESYKAP